MSSEDDDDDNVPVDTAVAESNEPAVPANGNGSTASTTEAITPKQTDTTGKAKRKWKDSEVHAVEQHPMRVIQTGKVPKSYTPVFTCRTTYAEKPVMDRCQKFRKEQKCHLKETVQHLTDVNGGNKNLPYPSDHYSTKQDFPV